MYMSSEDIDYEESDSSGENRASEEQNYKVQISSAHYTKMASSNKKEVNKKRVKRVVSCKRKSRHLSERAGVRKRPSINAKTFEAFNKDSEQFSEVEVQDGCCSELRSVHQANRMEEQSIRYSDYFSEITKDHKQMSELLFGRNLKLKIALTLWRRNIGELLSFLIKIQDLSVLVDCLPIFTKRLADKCAHVSVGFCVDLFPLVKNVLRSRYETYQIIALLWIQAVLTKWLPQLSQLDCDGHDVISLDYSNIYAIKQQLQGLWRQAHPLYFTTEAMTEIWKTIESQLYGLRL
ncbi:KATNB1-like protein 1 [Hoplias malabaricus]|uniref:KATNB1-like protein 1 n=1 Tax=Hoplias malabaricus TaxID=27720 RepID=UPI003461E1BE